MEFDGPVPEGQTNGRTISSYFFSSVKEKQAPVAEVKVGTP